MLAPPALALMLVSAVLHAEDLQAGRVDLRLERAPVGVTADDFIAAVVDLHSVDLPTVALRKFIERTARLPGIGGRVAVVSRSRGRGRENQQPQRKAVSEWNAVHESDLCWTTRMSMRPDS